MDYWFIEESKNIGKKMKQIPDNWYEGNPKFSLKKYHYVTKTMDKEISLIIYKSWNSRCQRWEYFSDTEDSLNMSFSLGFYWIK